MFWSKLSRSTLAATSKSGLKPSPHGMGAPLRSTASRPTAIDSATSAPKTAAEPSTVAPERMLMPPRHLPYLGVDTNQ